MTRQNGFSRQRRGAARPSAGGRAVYGHDVDDAADAARSCVIDLAYAPVVPGAALDGRVDLAGKLGIDAVDRSPGDDVLDIDDTAPCADDVKVCRIFKSWCLGR